jgi:uncharacterized membrane protein YphA (DoxX/SURF4 family)
MRKVHIIIWALRILLAGVFLFAAYSKLKQSYLVFAMSIDSYQLLPEWAVLAVARTLPPLELLIGAGILLGWKLRYFALAGALRQRDDDRLRLFRGRRSADLENAGS